MAGISHSFGLTNEQRRVPQKVDLYLLLGAVILLVAGFMSIYSEGISRDGAAYFRKQLICFFIGLAPFSLFAFVHPKVWFRNVNWLYLLNVALLVSVLMLGKDAKGAQRWINIGPVVQFQPSELAKLLLVLTLASFYSVRQESIQKLSTFLLGLLHISVPLILVLEQPHLGAALVIVVTWLAISLVAGVPLKYLAVVVVLLGSVVGALTNPAVQKKLLRPYQILRVEALLGIGKDKKGKDYQTDRAEIAFGVGGVMGTGYLRGEQKEKHFIPEQHTDFIFSVVGEEGGLIGCTMVLAAFSFFYYRVFLVMLNAREPYYKMIAAGIFGVLVFHTFVNIGMVLRLLPVVGLWLPFLSYGGTALWMCMSSVALLLNVRRREKPLLF